MNQGFDISIIIPVFNGAPYLKKCFETLQKQNSALLSIQILFIDDASTDKSLELIQNSKLKNVNIIQFKSNMGQSAARNVGIKNALGRYVFFQDADDSIENNSLETLFLKKKSYDSDFTFSDHKRIENLEDQRKNKYDYIKEKVFKKKEIIKAMNEEYENPNTGHLGLFGCNGRLIKRSLLIDNNILFDESLRWNEDKTFSWVVLSHVKKAVYIREKLYSFYVNPHIKTAGIEGLIENFSIENIKSITKHINRSLKTIGLNENEIKKITQKTLIFHSIKVLISISIRLILNKIELKKGNALRKKIINQIINDNDIKSAIKKYKPSINESYFLPKAISLGSTFLTEFFCNLRANKIINLRRYGKV
jgi:glycosyltransferase involved in cell wall biosynthesis